MLGVVFFRNLVMDLVAMDVIFKLATSHKLDVCMYCYLFQVISGFNLKSLVMGMDWMDKHFKLATSSSLVSLFYCKQFQTLKTVNKPSHGWDRRGLQTGNLRVCSSDKIYQYIFSVSLKFGAYYITVQYGELIKKCYLMLPYTFFAFPCFSS